MHYKILEKFTQTFILLMLKATKSDHMIFTNK